MCFMRSFFSCDPQRRSSTSGALLGSSYIDAGDLGCLKFPHEFLEDFTENWIVTRIGVGIEPDFIIGTG